MGEGGEKETETETRDRNRKSDRQRRHQEGNGKGRRKGTGEEQSKYKRVNNASQAQCPKKCLCKSNNVHVNLKGSLSASHNVTQFSDISYTCHQSFLTLRKTCNTIGTQINISGALMKDNHW